MDEYLQIKRIVAAVSPQAETYGLYLVSPRGKVILAYNPDPKFLEVKKAAIAEVLAGILEAHHAPAH